MSIPSIVPLRRTLFAAGCALTLAACSDSNTGGAPFSAEGTVSDMNAVSSSFDSPAMSSLSWSAGAMDNIFGAPVVRTSTNVIRNATAKGNLAETARHIAQSASSFMAKPQAGVALAVLPAEVLGTTYEYNRTSGQYEASERTGAPANGVRFILYSINPITHVPTEPLTEAGYADVLDQSTASSNALRLQLVSGGTTYLDYGVTGTGSETAATVVVNGFVTDGTTRVNFDLSNSLSQAANGTLGFNYQLDVPSLDLALHYIIGVTRVQTSSALADINISIAGPHGDVGINGNLTEGAGELTATVNGDDFAVVTLGDDSEVTSITKPGGGALTPSEYAALAAIWGMVLKGLDVFEDLLDPIDNLM